MSVLLLPFFWVLGLIGDAVESFSTALGMSIGAAIAADLYADFLANVTAWFSSLLSVG